MGGVTEMKTCGTCGHWIEKGHPKENVGACYAAPPAVLIQMLPVEGGIQMPGQPMPPPGSQLMAPEPMPIAPPTGRNRRACGAHIPKPENGEATLE